MKHHLTLLLSLIPSLCSGGENDIYRITVQNKSPQTLHLLYQPAFDSAPLRIPDTDLLLIEKMDRSCLSSQETSILLLKEPRLSIATAGSVYCTITDINGHPLVIKQKRIKNKPTLIISQNKKTRAILFSDAHRTQNSYNNNKKRDSHIVCKGKK